MPTSKAREHYLQGKILVLGASGYIGSHLLPYLLAQNYQLRAACRHPENLPLASHHALEHCHCNALDPQSLSNALQGVKQVIYLIHSMSDGKGYAERDRVAARNLALAAHQAGVEHIVYLGSLTADATRSTHLRSREQTGEALHSTGIKVTEIRAPIIIGPGSAPFEVIRDVVNHLSFGILPKQMHSKSSPIALENLLAYMSATLDTPAMQGLTLDIAGPQKLSYVELMQAYANHLNKPFRSIVLPNIPIQLMRLFVPLLTSAPPGIIRALLGGLYHDIQSEPSLAQKLYPQQLLSLEQAFEQTDNSEAQQQDSLSWYHGNMIYRLHNNLNAYYGEAIHVCHSAKATPAQIWQVLRKLGGHHGYYYLDLFWQMRGWIDRLFGGEGLRRYRENPIELFSGEVLDNWLIKEARREKRLFMQFLMRSPGAGCLEFSIDPEPDGHSRLSITAYWHPKGLWGRLYWILFKPAHLILFHGMIKTILKQAAKAPKP